MDARIFGSKIAELRKSRNMTQQQLADELLVTYKAVSKWETGGGLPDVSIIPTLASVLGISIDELMSESAVENAGRGSNENPPGENRSGRRYIRKPAVIALLALAIAISFFAGFLINKTQSSILRNSVKLDVDEGFGVTSEIAKSLYEIQLAEDIRVQILGLPEVEEASIVVSAGYTSPFLNAVDRDVRASVLLTLPNGIELPDQAVQSIAWVIRNSVNDIENENITITDSNMNYYPIND